MIKKVMLAVFVASALAMSAQAGTGVYASVGAGIGGMDTTNYSDSGPFTGMSLRSGASYRAMLGYLFGTSGNLNYGLELGYTGYPKNTYSYYNAEGTYTGYMVDVLAVGKYNFDASESGFFVVGKVGAASVSQKYEITVSGVDYYSKTVTALKPELAVGAGYNINKNVSLDLTLSRVFGNQADPDARTIDEVTQVSSVNTLLAGITYNFSS